MSDEIWTAYNKIGELRAEIERLREELAMYKQQYTKALKHADDVFQGDVGHPAMLPGFIKLGEDKLGGVVKLAEEYIKLKAEVKRLEADLDTYKDRLAKEINSPPDRMFYN